MSFHALSVALESLGSATHRAAGWQTSSDQYREAAACAGRAYERAAKLATPALALGRYTRARRTVEAAMDVADGCLEGLVGLIDTDALMYRADAMQRSAARVAALRELGGQSTQGSDEPLVAEGVRASRLDLLDALFSVQRGQPVESQSAHET